MSLRTRLLLGLITLVAAGLVAVAILTYTQQRAFLLRRVDQQALAAAPLVSRALDEQGYNVSRAAGSAGLALPVRSSAPGGGPRPPAPSGPVARPPVPFPGAADLAFPPGRRARHHHDHVGALGRGGGPGPGGGPQALPPGTYGERRDAAGRSVGHFSFTYGQGALASPRLPAHLPVTGAGQEPRFQTVGSAGHSGLRYRVLARTTGDQPGITVVAIPLRDVDQTLSRLLTDEAVLAAIVLASLALLTWLLVRAGLRPLDRMGETADAIAGGDLSRRVSPATHRTEVGRLGLALNAMLGQIETAFAERRASEDRLRRFLADASHELRTPLASIRGYAELFRMGAAEDPVDTARAMKRIEQEATRMGTLVEGLLTLARMDQEPEGSREPVDLGRLARDSADDALATAPDRRIAVSVRGPASTLGDPGGLRQIVGNLLRNALVHTPAGTPIEIMVRRDGEDVLIEVRDHGPGLPPGAAQSIFERFWRADPARTRGPAGAGLGLAIVAAIVQAHGGTAEAQDAADGGALFRVRLPAYSPPTAGPPGAAAPPGPDPGAQGPAPPAEPADRAGQAFP